MQAKAVVTAGSRRRNITGTREYSGRTSSVLIGRSSSEQVETVADLEESRRGDRNGEEEHDAFEQLLPQRLDIEDEEKQADRAVGERAEDGADRAAAAAEKRHAADHDRSDRREGIG